MKTMAKESSIECVIKPLAKDIGDNFIVKRALPDVNKRAVGPFIFWDHMGPVMLSGQKEMKVRAHPHIGLATITWLFSGEIMHRDSLGNEQPIRPGEVNWMTAGSGIVHSERARAQSGEMKLEGIQLWLALPKEFEEVDASFFHCKLHDLPTMSLEGSKSTLIAGEAWGKKSPVPVYSRLFYVNADVEANSDYQFAVGPDCEGALYIVEGEIEIEGEVFGPSDLVSFVKGAAVNFKALGQCRVMIFGGEPFPEKRIMWWNFVSSSQERIDQAKLDWVAGNFLPVINEDEFIPLPER
jgi:redox-sensitive bicupin YhaK (pirin superfamily)